MWKIYFVPETLNYQELAKQAKKKWLPDFLGFQGEKEESSCLEQFTFQSWCQNVLLHQQMLDIAQHLKELTLPLVSPRSDINMNQIISNSVHLQQYSLRDCILGDSGASFLDRLPQQITDFAWIHQSYNAPLEFSVTQNTFALSLPIC